MRSWGRLLAGTEWGAERGKNFGISENFCRGGEIPQVVPRINTG
jgi:hypothetical protein